MKERLVKYGVCEEIAEACARNLADTSLCGVYSHGLNRFPRIITLIQKGVIKPNNKPSPVRTAGAFEVWDGNMGMGNTNAAFAMERAITLAKQNGIGAVALRHTNHWQRGGAFGIQAANSGCAGICWTTTMPNMPAWGGADRRIGNNPLVFCVPYDEDDGVSQPYVMADSAMAQFSYGALESAQLAGKQLPVVGGYDEHGALTTDPAAIAKTWRVLPMGFWKGSALSVMLDLFAVLMSDGKPVCEIGKHGNTPEDEYDLNQVFIAINIQWNEHGHELVRQIVYDLKASIPIENGEALRYPGEREHKIRAENLKEGIPVNENIWNTVLAL
jgi:3-dehydro-L-gulonate 2-dehydrogenase